MLTRDVGVLKHRVVTRGYFVRQTQPARQLIEVLRQFDLVPQAKPFSRCVRCNSSLRTSAEGSRGASAPTADPRLLSRFLPLSNVRAHLLARDPITAHQPVSRDGLRTAPMIGAA